VSKLIFGVILQQPLEGGRWPIDDKPRYSQRPTPAPGPDDAVIRLSGQRGGETMRAMTYVVRPVESVAKLAELRARRERRLSSR
jgi:hypothetical protein